MSPDVTLRPLELADEAAYRALNTALRGEESWRTTGSRILRRRTWAEYLDHLEVRAGDRSCPVLVQGAFAAGELIGVAVVRLHRAPSRGHAAYAVHPDYRRRGYATAILRAELDMLARAGIAKAQLVTRAENTASQRVITRAGGRCSKVVPRKNREPLHVFTIRTRMPWWRRLMRGH